MMLRNGFFATKSIHLKFDAPLGLGQLVIIILKVHANLLFS